MDMITTYLLAVWDILLEASPYVLFGFFVAGLLKGFLPADFVARHLGRGKRAPVFKAALFGVPLPLCSCGVIPAAAGLRQQGASKGATTSFLVSTPETGVDSMAVTYALLDPLMTILRPVAAFISAITAGLLVDALPEEKEQPQTAGTMAAQAFSTPGMSASTTPDTQPSCGCNAGSCQTGDAHGHDHSDHAGHEHAPAPQHGFAAKFRYGMEFAFGELITDIGKWLIIGVFIAALITAFLPVSVIEQYVGDGLFGMMLMVVVGVPMYVCATASTPIAAALALKGLSPGAALVFLLAGPATNAATITVVARTLGKKVAAVYVGSIAVVSVLMGLAVNWLYGALGLSVTGWVHSQADDTHGLLAVASAVALVALVIVRLYQQHRNGNCGCAGHSHGCCS